MANGLEKQEQEEQPWRILEFYSGIGGMMYSLVSAAVNAEVVEAFDINDTANDVYQHNFGHRPYQGNIQSLTAADLDCYGGPMHGFFLLLANLTLDRTSDTHTKMIEILGRTNFVLQEFILSPLQFGVPYSRPHYFCLVPSSLTGFLGKEETFNLYNQVFDNQLLRSLGPLFGDANADETVFSELDEPQESRDALLESCEPIESFLEFKNCSDQSEVQFSLKEYWRKMKGLDIVVAS